MFNFIKSIFNNEYIPIKKAMKNLHKETAMYDAAMWKPHGVDRIQFLFSYFLIYRNAKGKKVKLYAKEPGWFKEYQEIENKVYAANIEVAPGMKKWSANLDVIIQGKPQAALRLDIPSEGIQPEIEKIAYTNVSVKKKEFDAWLQWVKDDGVAKLGEDSMKRQEEVYNERKKRKMKGKDE